MNLRQDPAYCRIQSISVVHRNLAANQSKRQIDERHWSSLFSLCQHYNTTMTDQVIRFDIQGHEREIFFASPFTFTSRLSGRIIRTWLPKLKIHPTSSSVSATFRAILSCPSFMGNVSWLECHSLSLTQAATFLENTSSTSIRRPRMTMSASWTYASTSNPKGI